MPTKYDKPQSQELPGTVHPEETKTSLWTLITIYVVAVGVCLKITSPAWGPFNVFVTIAWSLYLPIVILAITSVVVGRWHNDSVTSLSKFEGATDKKIVIVLPTLGRPGNLNALKRVVGSILEHAPGKLKNFRVDIVVDEGPDLKPLYDWLGNTKSVRVLVVPSSYRTPNGARFKTRANQYALEARTQAGENTKDVFVYHLDDDTHVGVDTIASIAEFAERWGDDYFLAQGILAFPHQLSPSWLSRMADSMRPANDITLFSLYTGWLGKPMVGLHGEHLLVRGDIEEEIGWDYPETVIEDAHFALEFCKRHPGRSRMLNSYSYGASPASVRDLVRQRRRWSEGLLRLIFKRSLSWRHKGPLAYQVICWALAPIQYVGTVWITSELLGFHTTSPVNEWFMLGWSMVFAGVLWQYLEGLKINLSASGLSHKYYLYAPLMLPLLYVFGIIEGIGGALGLIRFFGIGRQKESEVINKPV